MKVIQLTLILSLFVLLKINAQTCTPGFVYTLSPNGNITFSNTSVLSSSSLSPTFLWSTGNGLSFTTTSVFQTVSTTFTSSGTYFVQLNTQNCGQATQVITHSISGCPLSASMTLLNPWNGTPTVSFVSTCTGTTTGTTYLWDFGDGTTGTGLNPTHMYSTNGAFGYTLIATNSPGCSSFIQTDPIVGLSIQNLPPIVRVCGYTPTLTYTSGPMGNLNFSVTAITGVAWYLNWDFGDSPYGPIPTSTTSINHVYFNGVHTPSVYIFNTLLNCGVFTPSTAITITNNPCNANSAFTYTAISGGLVQFSKTNPSSNPNIAYSWYFGDGISSNQLSPTHVYLSAGNYTAILIAYDIAYPIADPLDTFITPCKAVSKVNLNIAGISCIANSNFTVFPSGMPQSYFINMIYPYNVTSGTWNWGDGSTSNDLYAYHTYSAAGSYDICLTVTTSCGASSSNCFSQYLSKGQSGDMVYVSVMPSAISNGINENSLVDDLLQVFPNPTNGAQLTVKLSEGFNKEKIGIYDLVGKEVAELAVPENEVSLKIDVSGLNIGLYFLRVKSSRSGKTLKFIVTRE
jgi:PKD repeat protein